VSHKKTVTELDAARCTAKSKATRARCRWVGLQIDIAVRIVAHLLGASARRKFPRAT
jgi:hypothetical protein